MTEDSRKTALVVGGSGEIGLAIAARLAEMSYRLALAARDQERLEAARSRVTAAGAEVECFNCDITDEAAVSSVIAAIAARFGRIDVLVNAAGIGKSDFIARARTEVWDEQYKTNALGVVYVCRAVLAVMKRQRAGHIINIGSTVGRIGQPGMASYGASKAAMMVMTDSLRGEARRHGIKVSSIAPERVATRMQGADASVGERLILTADVAEAVAFLLRLSPAAVVPELSIHNELE